MYDPLERFDWSTLNDRYDAKCARYNPQSQHMARFGQSRPDRDRTLYQSLCDVYTPRARAAETDPMGAYMALLYWKLYSQRTTESNLATCWGIPGGFSAAMDRLRRVLNDLPASLDRRADRVVELVRSLDVHALPGMKSRCAIPVRTTFLHFIYPNTVPILDKMVLQAVGVDTPGAKQNYGVLREYIPFAWSLADKYAPRAGAGRRESPLRLLDMALWVDRGAR